MVNLYKEKYDTGQKHFSPAGHLLAIILSSLKKHIFYFIPKKP